MYFYGTVDDLFLEAVKQNDTDKMKEYLDQGKDNKRANIEALNENRKSALVLAVEHGNTEALALLINKGVNINRRDEPMTNSWDNLDPIFLLLKGQLSQKGQKNRYLHLKMLIDNGAKLCQNDLDLAKNAENIPGLLTQAYQKQNSSEPMTTSTLQYKN